MKQVTLRAAVMNAERLELKTLSSSKLLFI
jgi:hypothetical protein